MTKKKSEKITTKAGSSPSPKPKTKVRKKATAPKSTAKKSSSESATIGRELSTGTDGGFIVLLGESPDSSTEGEAAVAGDRVLDLGTIATISNVVDLHTHAQHLLEKTEPVVIRSAEVGLVDTAALQLLCSFCSDAASQGIEVSWDQPSVTFSRAVSRLGLDTKLCGI
jgi:anti-anti-sigma regulatory factor